jgi:hypothetical protein
VSGAPSSINGGASFQTIVENGTVPPNNIGPRSIESAAGLGASYSSLMTGGIETATTGEKVFCGPTDDPFFVDLGGIFDLGDAPRQNGNPRDGLACYNVSAICIQVPTQTLLKAGASPAPLNILDGDHVIVHVHVVRFPGDPGLAVIDIFRVEDDAIVEHWDVLQEVPAKPVNPNPMF